MLNTQRVFATTCHDSDVVAYKVVAGRMPTICTVIETIANLTDLLGKIWSHMLPWLPWSGPISNWLWVLQ